VWCAVSTHPSTHRFRVHGGVRVRLALRLRRVAVRGDRARWIHHGASTARARERRDAREEAATRLDGSLRAHLARDDVRAVPSRARPQCASRARRNDALTLAHASTTTQVTSSEQARDAGTRAEAAHRAELEEIDAIPEVRATPHHRSYAVPPPPLDDVRFVFAPRLTTHRLARASQLPPYAERADVVELLARADALDARDAADEDAADAPTVAPPSLALSRALSLRSSPSNDADVDAERPS